VMVILSGSILLARKLVSWPGRWKCAKLATTCVQRCARCAC